MFYFDKVLDKTVLKSDKMPVNHFFTTRDLILKSKEENSDFQYTNRENLKKIFKLEKLITPSQRHTSNIKYISDENFDMTDGLIADNPAVGIFLNFADCTPIMFYDTKQNIAAICHAGWRGTVQKIAQKTVELMKSSPNDIICLIGPCICFNCFETNEEIKNKLISSVQNPEKLYKRGEGDRWFADLKKINETQLREIGVENIDITDFCTCCDNEKFFSYRRENKTTNRMSAFIVPN